MTEKQTQLTATRKFEGEVVSTAMNKTIIVRVDAMVLNTKYNKNYKVSKRYAVHDEKAVAKKATKSRLLNADPSQKQKNGDWWKF